jgi:hypothetical protein
MRALAIPVLCGFAVGLFLGCDKGDKKSVEERLCQQLQTCNDLEGLTVQDCADYTVQCTEDFTTAQKADWDRLANECLDFADCGNFGDCWSQKITECLCDTVDCGSGSGSSSGGSSASSGAEGPACVADGEVCTQNGDCCGFAGGTSQCVNFAGDFGIRCTAVCTMSTECAEDCCAPTEDSGSVCAPPVFCGAQSSTTEDPSSALRSASP